MSEGKLHLLTLMISHTFYRVKFNLFLVEKMIENKKVIFADHFYQMEYIRSIIKLTTTTYFAALFFLLCCKKKCCN